MENTVVFQAIFTGENLPDYLITGDHVGFWTGTGVYAAAMMFSNPVTVGIALGYGALEVGSWLYNGKSIEQNIFDK